MKKMITASNSPSGIYFLIGFMGSGKSMLSKGVQQLIDVISIEMDDEIEKMAGKTINEIFAAHGEEGFRTMEKETLLRLIETYRNHEQAVLISTGGGAPCYQNNMKIMKMAGTTIFINPSIPRLAGRLEHRNSERPLIKGKNREEIEEFISIHLEQRLTYYQKAHIVVNTIYDDKALNIRFLCDIIMASD